MADDPPRTGAAATASRKLTERAQILTSYALISATNPGSGESRPFQRNEPMIRMLRFGAKALAVLALATLSQAAAAGGNSTKDTPAEPVERGVYFSGYDVVTDSRYTYSGIIVALNGDMGRDGFFARAYGAYGNFDQNPGDGRQWQGDVALGYMFTRSS